MTNQTNQINKQNELTFEESNEMLLATIEKLNESIEENNRVMDELKEVLNMQH